MIKQGTLVEVTEAIHTGTRTVLGTVTMGLIEEIAGKEVMTHVTVEGMVTTAHITGLPIPVEVEKPVTLEMIPVKATRLTHLVAL